MRQLYALAATVIALTASTIAPARAEKVGIVLESYVGERSPQAESSLKEILAALADRGYDYGPDVVGRVFEARVSRPALAAGLPTDFSAQADRGHRAYVSGQFDAAVETLSPLIDAAHANPGAFAADQSLRSAVAKALVALAISHGRIGDAPAQDQAFGELVRSFPDMVQTRSALGSEAFAQFERVRKALGAVKAGKLTVSATDEAAVVFINEKIERVGTVSKPVIPGEYRVFVQSGRKLSRVHIINVAAGQDAAIEIDLGFDAAVHTGPVWTGLAFPTAGDREQYENIYAADFARAIGARGVAVAGVDAASGRSLAFGTLVNVRTGRDIRRASVALEPAPAPDRLRGIATFLVDNRATPGVDVVVNDNNAQPSGEPGGGSGARSGGGGGARFSGRSDGGDTGGRWGGWKYLTGGTAVVAIGLGSYFLWLDGNDDPNQPGMTYNMLPAGIATLAGGAVLGAVSVYLFASDGGGKSSSARTAYIIPTGDGAAVGFTTRF